MGTVVCGSVEPGGMELERETYEDVCPRCGKPARTHFEEVLEGGRINRYRGTTCDARGTVTGQRRSTWRERSNVPPNRRRRALRRSAGRKTAPRWPPSCARRTTGKTGNSGTGSSAGSGCSRAGADGSSAAPSRRRRVAESGPRRGRAPVRPLPRLWPRSARPRARPWPRSPPRASPLQRRVRAQGLPDLAAAREGRRPVRRGPGGTRAPSRVRPSGRARSGPDAGQRGADRAHGPRRRAEVGRWSRGRARRLARPPSPKVFGGEACAYRAVAGLAVQDGRSFDQTTDRRTRPRIPLSSATRPPLSWLPWLWRSPTTPAARRRRPRRPPPQPQQRRVGRKAPGGVVLATDQVAGCRHAAMPSAPLGLACDG